MRRPAHVRTRARSWTLQVLYAREMSGREVDLVPFAEEALARRRVADRYRPYIDRLLAVLSEHGERVDEVLRERMPNWRLERLAAIDRNILRIGAAELLYVDDVPGKVAIHEAIRLAEKYGGKESPRFVNGVLDAVYQDTLVAG
ncbi:MAG TPA: transcription antitermination factor NusB [Gemmatimonadota bacterium]|nr:transcription antitermination factor NusB [Gemmatimonadota bacterium]